MSFKKSILMMLAVAFTQSTSHAFFDFDQELELLDSADLICEQEGIGVAVAIELPKNGAAGVVWETDFGAEDGVRVSKVKFARGSSAERFSFSGVKELMGEKMGVKGQFNNMTLVYGLTSGRMSVTLPCRQK